VEESQPGVALFCQRPVLLKIMQSATANPLECKKCQGSALSKVVLEGNRTFSQGKRPIFRDHKELKCDGSISGTNCEKADRVAVSAQKYLIASARKS
jgi:hypothetical protein